MKNEPLVSVLVATRNSNKYLQKCLESVKSQTYKNWELILVDNYSSDDSAKIAKRFTKHVFILGPERSTQYNLAAKKAKGRYLYRIDSDFVLEPEVIEQCVEKCEIENYSAIAVHNVSDDSLGFWSQVRKLERNCYIDDDLIVAVRFIKKDVFWNLGGFDERMYAGEDYDLHNRFVESGLKWGRIKAKEVHLGEVTSLWEFAKHSFYYGKNLMYYIDKYPHIGGRQMILIRSAFIKHWRELARHPIITLGLLIMNIVKFTSGGLGFCLARLGLVQSR